MMKLPPSDALSIVKNGPESFEGRKLGILLTDGADAALFAALTAACDKEGAAWEVIAPKIGGAVLSDRKKVPAKQKIDGGPSVLYDAVAILVSDAGARQLAGDSATRDFISDAFAHCKFIGFNAAAEKLLAMAGVMDKQDDGFVALGPKNSATAFIKACRALRFWDREPVVDMDARK